MEKYPLSKERILKLKELIEKDPKKWSKEEGVIISIQQDYHKSDYASENCFEVWTKFQTEKKEEITSFFHVWQTELNILLKKNLINNENDLIGKKVDLYFKFQNQPYLPDSPPAHIIENYNVYFD